MNSGFAFERESVCHITQDTFEQFLFSALPSTSVWFFREVLFNAYMFSRCNKFNRYKFLYRETICWNVPEYPRSFIYWNPIVLVELGRLKLISMKHYRTYDNPIGAGRLSWVISVCTESRLVREGTACNKTFFLAHKLGAFLLHIIKCDVFPTFRLRFFADLPK